MSYKDEMSKAHAFVTANAPEVANPHFDAQKPHVEQLVTCLCFKQYRVFVNGDLPISDTKMSGVFCPHCGAAACDSVKVSGHSAGCFNASMIKM